MADEHKLHEPPPHEEIAKLAYAYWEDEGKPWGDPAATFANWIDAELYLEDQVHPPHGFNPPTE